MENNEKDLFKSIWKNKINLTDAFTLALTKRAEAFNENKCATKQNKDCINRFLGNYANDCAKIVLEEYNEIFTAIHNAYTKVSDIEDTLTQLEITKATLERELAALRMQKAAESQLTDDPKMLTALRVYAELTKKDSSDDAYTRQRKITAAAAICGAYLGLQSFLGAPTTSATKDNN